VDTDQDKPPTSVMPRPRHHGSGFFAISARECASVVHACFRNQARCLGILGGSPWRRIGPRSG
jgi:hypothetical protein